MSLQGSYDDNIAMLSEQQKKNTGNNKNNFY
jgi:hypothetical protein